MNPGLSRGDLCKFLAFETFAELKPSTILVAEIKQDGTIALLESFGLSAKVITDWNDIPLTIHLPLTESVKSNQVILLKREDSSTRYPGLSNFGGIPDKWESYLICPILPHGLIALTLDSIPKLETYTDLYVRTIAAITLHNVRIHQYGYGRDINQRSITKKRKSNELSDRQQAILRLLEKGLTNPIIADQIGYSESLVRQETMAIYAALNISGRKELLEKKSG